MSVAIRSWSLCHSYPGGGGIADWEEQHWKRLYVGTTNYCQSFLRQRASHSLALLFDSDWEEDGRISKRQNCKEEGVDFLFGLAALTLLLGPMQAGRGCW